MRALKDYEKELMDAVNSYLNSNKTEFQEAFKKLNQMEISAKKKYLTTEDDIKTLSEIANIKVLAQNAVAAHRKITMFASKEFEEEKASKELQFAEEKKTMGRPVLTLEQMSERAKEHYEFNLAFMRSLAKHHKIEPMSEFEIQKKAARTTKGRKRKDRVLAIMKYIRSIEKKLADAKEIPLDLKMPKGKGRKPKTRAEAVEHFELIITDAKEELAKELVDKTEYELLYYSLYELRNNKREAKKIGNDTLLAECISKIKEVEIKMKALNDNKETRSLSIEARQKIMKAKEAYAEEVRNKMDKERITLQQKLIKAKNKSIDSNEDEKKAG